MNKLLTILIILLPASLSGFGQTATDTPERVVAFRFVPGKDMFYIPWAGNGAELNRLYTLVDEYRHEIASGQMPVQVDGYCASLPTVRENLNTAYVRANRVKSELIVHKGLKEADFVTRNFAHACDGKRDVVIVTLRIPANAEPAPGVEETQFDEPSAGAVAPQSQPACEEPASPELLRPAAEPEPQPEIASKPQSQPEPTAPAATGIQRAAERKSGPWSVGLHVGMPFFWGDMVTCAADRSRMGVLLGVGASYRINSLLGASLTAEWAQGRTGARDYARDFILDADGMTWYTAHAGVAYKDLYARVGMWSVGLHLDVDVLPLFGRRMEQSRFRLTVSPAVYAQHFSSKVFTRADDRVYVGQRLSKGVSLGLGGDVALRYALSHRFDIQLKATALWITDNAFENIETVGSARLNAMCGISAGVVWKIGGTR